MSRVEADVSIVFDTETDDQSHGIRLADVLAAWTRQTRADRVAEWIFVSPRRPSAEEQALVAGVSHRWIHRPNLRYYEQKNAGLLETRTRYAALSDSDAAPDPDWLEAALEVLETAPPEVAAVTGWSQFRPGPFSRELALALWPHLRRTAGDCEQILAHNVLFRVDPVRSLLFETPRIRHGAENALTAELLRSGHRVRFDPRPRMTHNYARTVREIWPNAAARGFSYATLEAHEGKTRAGVLRNAIGRYRVLARRLFGSAEDFGIAPLRYPLSLLFFAWYVAAVGSGWRRALRGDPEPLSPF